MALINQPPGLPQGPGAPPPDPAMAAGAAPGGPPQGAPPMPAPGGDVGAQAQDAVASSESGAGSDFKIDPAAVREKMKIPPQFQDGYNRLVQAGSKLLFNPQTKQLVMTHLHQQGQPIGPAMGRGIAGLMLMIFRKTNYKAPSQVLIPAGLDLLVQACDFILQTKMLPLGPQDVSLAVKTFVATMLRQFGGSPDKIKQQIGVTGDADDNGQGGSEPAVPEDGSPIDDSGAGGGGLVNGQPDAGRVPDEEVDDEGSGDGPPVKG